MNTQLVQDICYSFLSRASQDQIAIGTTKLVKLLYLIDCEYFQWHRKTLTDAPWLFYHYGPYCEELIEVAHHTPGIAPLQEVEFEDGKFFRGYRLTEFHGDPMQHAHFTVRGVVDDVYRCWGAVDLALVLDHVYYETQPMMNAVRFQPLDFSLIPNPRDAEREERPRNFASLIPEDRKRALRARLRESAGKYLARQKSITVAIDEVTADALETMGERD